MNEQLQHVDLLLAIFKNRFGTPTTTEESGTAEEILKHHQAGQHVMIYFSEAPLPRDHDRAQLEQLNAFKRKCQEQSLYDSFQTCAELKDRVTRHLSRFIELYSLATQQSSNEVAVYSDPIESKLHALTESAKELLAAAVACDGRLMNLDVIQGRIIKTDKHTFTEPGDARSEARWSAALKQLVDCGLVEGLGANQVVFQLTDLGFAVADKLMAQSK